MAVIPQHRSPSFPQACLKHFRLFIVLLAGVAVEEALTAKDCEHQ
jgi:hypothetical protein